MKIRIIKVGGKLIEDEQLLHRISQQLELESRDTILVHGGGTMAEQLATRLGIPTQMHDGRRITDQETLKVVVMAYAGWANKKIVSVLQSKGINACGLSGCDMGLITAHKREVREIDWGFVGDVDEVNTKELLELLQRGVVPVVSPITFASDGQLLNTNADSVAGAVANALSHFAEVECVFCFDKPGVLLDMEDENSLISVLSERDFQNYATQGLIHSGMLPKLTNAFQMLESGVSSVRLTSPLDLWGGQSFKKKNEMNPLELLKSMIAIPSFSGEEGRVADLLEEVLKEEGVVPSRKGNNVWACSSDFDLNRPTILLDAHIDTVKPSGEWKTDPFTPIIEEGKLYGLGSNDTGGSVVSMLAAFLTLNRKPQSYNLIWMASAEEENTGKGGIQSVLSELGQIDLALIGEPTGMQAAIAEKGLMVLDCIAKGRAGHAARAEGVNAIYEALPDIEWFRNYRFPKISQLLGEVKMTVTGIQAGSLHNVVPAKCQFVVDIRVNEYYSNAEIFDLIRQHVTCEVCPRSFSLNSSCIAESHPMVQRCKALGLSVYGSPTTSNQAVLPYLSLKIGPGESARSHTANEYITLEELKQGEEIYVQLLDGFIV